MAALVLLPFAIFVLYRELNTVRIADVIAAFHSIHEGRILLSGLASTISFACLGLYDVYAARVVAPGSVPVRRALFAGIASNAISNTLGFHVLTAGAVRYRLYSPIGMSAGDVARITTLAGAAIWISFAVVAGLSLLFGAGPGVAKHYEGAIALAALGTLLYWLYKKKRRLRLGRWSLPLPDGGIGTWQMITGIVEMTAAIGGLYVLLPADSIPGFFDFSLLYMTAIALGIVSGAPGGAGVFEATLLAFFPAAATPLILAALLLYRLIYNILPFFLAAAMFLISERHGHQLDKG